MEKVLVLKDWDDCDIYGVLTFNSERDRCAAVEIIKDVKSSLLDGWSLEDIWDALLESGIDYECYNDDVYEFYI